MQQPDEPAEEKEEIEEEVEDEEFIDEDCEESGDRRCRIGFGPTGKTVTLQMLLAADILTPGVGTMAIEYLGQRFIGDLLPDGKIKSQETDIVFASPSAWAIHCKRIINPEKKSGCGWASVKYRGKKLDAYKNAWFKRKQQELNKENEGTDEDMEKMVAPAPIQRRIVVKHHALGGRSLSHDANTLVESTPFSSIGKIQPFLVSMATNAVLVMDLHCHLTTSEVVGYLAGHWDVNAHNLAITHAFPCRSRLGDRELAPMVEADIYRAMEQRHLSLVGWYHSHPHAPATPTLRDMDSQLDYQIRMKGNSDASYTPCVGVICAPYNADSTSLESTVVSYWVMPPPESKPNEYSKPMLMNYSVVQDQFLSQDALNEMKKCVDFYKKESDFINFTDKYKNNTTYLDKLKNTLTSKFPRDQSDGILWGFIRDLVCQNPENGSEIPNTVNTAPSPSDRVSLLVPSVKSGGGGGGLMTSDIASALFASGNFPSASSLLGLTSDSSRSSTLGLSSLGRSSSNNLANLALSSSSLRDMALSSSNLGNMFISPLSFTMDSLSSLKSMGNNLSIVASTSKGGDMPSKDSSSFATPDNLDKNCTITSGQM